MRVCVYRDVEAEAVRASIRIRDVEITAMPKQTAHLTGQDRPVPLTVGSVVWVAGLVKRPVYKGFEGKITAVLSPNSLHSVPSLLADDWLTPIECDSERVCLSVCLCVCASGYPEGSGGGPEGHHKASRPLTLLTLVPGAAQGEQQRQSC